MFFQVGLCIPLETMIGQNLRKTRYQNFLILSGFASFSYFWQNNLLLIAIKPQYPKCLNKLKAFVKLFVEI